MLRHRFGNIDQWIGAVRPLRECFGNRFLDRGCIELSRHVHVGARSSEVVLIELLNLCNRVSLDHRLGREKAAVRMIRIQRLHELFLSYRLRLRLLDREIADLILLQAFELRGGQQRMHGHISEQPDHLWAVFRQHVAVDTCNIRSHTHVNGAAHRCSLLGYLLRGA